MFSKEAIEYLQANDYKLKNEEEGFTITHSRASHVFIVLFGVLMSIGCVFLSFLNAFIGFSGLIAVIILTVVMYDRSKGRTVFKIDMQNRIFHSYDPSSGKVWGPFETIEEIGFRSNYIQSYATASKPTNEEYLHTMFIRLEDEREIEVLQFDGDYFEPPVAFQQIHDKLKELFGSK